MNKINEEKTSIIDVFSSFIKHSVLPKIRK